MEDVILFVPDFTTLVGYLDANHPEMLERDEEGNMAMPPVVTGFDRTPAAMGPDGNSLMVYARLREHELAEWGGMPGVEVLAHAAYKGRNTSDEVYSALFADPEATAKYDSVYDRSDRTETDPETGEEYTYSVPERFGVMA